MPIVTVSPKYQIVIPKEIREKLKLKPGQELSILLDEANSFSVAPVLSLEELQAILSSVDTPPFEREKLDRPLHVSPPVKKRRRRAA